MRRLLIIILLVAIVGGGWYFYNKNKKGGVTNTSTTEGVFPSGEEDQASNVPGVLNEIVDKAVAPNKGGGEAIGQSSKFKALTSKPAAGFVSFYTDITKTIPADPNIPKSKPTTQTEKKHFIRYVSRDTGYVYEIADGEVPLQISNIYIPNVYEAYFADNNQTAILRFLRDDQKTIATYAVPIPAENKDGTRTQKGGGSLPDNISSVVVSPDTLQLLRLVKATDPTTLSRSTSANAKIVEIISSPLKEWLAFWPNQKSIYLQTKASYTAPGFLYLIDQTNKRLGRVLGDINGLTSNISPSGNYVLYSESLQGSFSTKVLNTKTGVTNNIGLKILPEKCSWLTNDDLVCAGNSSVPKASYPDDWYMGVTHLSDKIYHIYTTGNIYDVLYDDSEKDFDMTNISVDEVARSIYFLDKNSGLLWQFVY